MFLLENRNLSSKAIIIERKEFNLLFSVDITKTDNNQIEGRFGPTARFVLNAKPFRLDLFTNDQFVMSMNSKNMFNFEHYRKKPGYEEVL
jgi:hypothetical protein